MKNSAKSTNAKTWLELDLAMQSGSIWNNLENPKPSKTKKYKVPNSKPHILEPDPIKYGNIEIKNPKTQIIDENYI